MGWFLDLNSGLAVPSLALSCTGPAPGCCAPVILPLLHVLDCQCIWLSSCIHMAWVPEFCETAQVLRLAVGNRIWLHTLCYCVSLPIERQIFCMGRHQTIFQDHGKACLLAYSHDCCLWNLLIYGALAFVITRCTTSLSCWPLFLSFP